VRTWWCWGWDRAVGRARPGHAQSLRWWVLLEDAEFVALAAWVLRAERRSGTDRACFRWKDPEVKEVRRPWNVI
jgi:hypothetical protein